MIADPTARGDVGQDWRVKWLAARAVLCVAITGSYIAGLDDIHDVDDGRP
jgi:hypothetical protein